MSETLLRRRWNYATLRMMSSRRGMLSTGWARARQKYMALHMHSLFT